MLFTDGLLIALSALFCILQLNLAQTPILYGNEISQRNSFGIQSQRRTWIDSEVFIPPARIVAFRVYIHERAAGEVPIRFQIWSQVSQTQYTLLFDQMDVVPNITGEYQVNLTDPFVVNQRALIGWTTETRYNPISFQFMTGYKLYFRPLVTEDGEALPLPEVGSSYDFQPLPYPSIFSIAVVADQTFQGGVGATGATGLQGPPGNTGSTGPMGPRGEPGFSVLDDVDECLMNPCTGANQECVNTLGSFICKCGPGYVLDGSGNNCIDLDECELQNGLCEQICENLEGSVNCLCYPGYNVSRDGRSCEDINECTNGEAQCLMACVNEPGSYTCLEIAFPSPLPRALEQTGEEDKSLPEVSVQAVGAMVWLVVLTVIVLLLVAISLAKLRKRQGTSDTHGGDNGSFASCESTVNVAEEHIELDITDG